MLSWSLLPLLGPLILLLLGFVVGRRLERRHFIDLAAREQVSDLPMIILAKRGAERCQHGVLVTGSVVISHDYFKRFMAALRMLFGGRLHSYETLLERARREALLRLREAAGQLGATHVYNVKVETAAISGRGGQNRIGSLEVLVYGTAVITP